MSQVLKAGHMDTHNPNFNNYLMLHGDANPKDYPHTNKAGFENPAFAR